MKKLLKFLTLCVGLIIGSQAWAQHAHCAYGFQDSSCGGAIATAAQARPACPGSAGWTTAAIAQWLGSKYSAPQCNYQAPPTCPGDAGWTTAVPAQWLGSSYSAPQCTYTAPPACPAGYAQSGPNWNGSSWVNLSCTPTAPPVQTPAQMCAAKAATFGITLGPQTRGPYYPSGQPWAQRYYDNSTGPTWELINGTTTNIWEVVCLINETNMTWAPANMNPFEALQNYGPDQGGGAN